MYTKKISHWPKAAILSVILLLVGVAPAKVDSVSPLPAAVSSQWHTLELVGQTKFKKLGFHIYDASFWMQNNRLNDDFAANTCALSITYARNIRAERLLSSTEKQWFKLGYADKYPLQAWLKILHDIWPDVAPGDQLVFVMTPDGKNVFFSADKQLGIVEDPRFGPAFLAIWLGESSQYPKKRKELLGE